jgi:Leucine-rich repeat (LRR) protein
LYHIKRLELYRLAISSLVGIQSMVNLESLYAQDNLLTNINLSFNPNLENLDLQYNGVANIDLSNNTNLKSLNLEYNGISNLDLSNNSLISVLRLSNNNISNLDLSGLVQLNNLSINNNNLTSVDLTNNTNINYLELSDNNLTSIDLSSQPDLYSLTINNNNLSSIDLTNSPNINWVSLNDNGISNIDLSNNTNINHIYLDNNNIGSFLNFSSVLATLHISNNSLTTLELNNALQISDLRISGNPNLTCISFDYPDYLLAKFSDLVDLDISSFSSCGVNNVGQIKINDDAFETKLVNLGYDNQIDGYVDPDIIGSIITLDLSNSSDTPAYQKILSLDGIEHFTSLKNLYLDYNLVSDINLRKNLNLEKVSVSNNDLNFLDLSQNLNLFFLDASSNEIQVIDLKNKSQNFAYFNAKDNTNLTCVLVDNPSNYTSFYPNGIDQNVFTQFCTNRGIYISNPKLENTLLSLGHDDFIDNHVFQNDNTSYLLLYNSEGGLLDLDNIDYLFDIFQSLTDLRISNSTIKELIIDNEQLERIRLNDNILFENVRFENISNLTSVDGNRNNFISLVISNNPLLTNISLTGGNLLSTQFSGLESLTYLDLNNNNIPMIDVSQLPSLEQLILYSNDLTDLDLTLNNSLTNLNVSFNNFNQLDISNNPNIQTFICSENNLSSIDLSSNVSLNDFYGYSNNFNSIDLSNNTLLTRLGLYDNPGLSELDLSSNVELRQLELAKNNLSTLDLSNNLKLDYLSLSYNEEGHLPLDNLDLSNNTLLSSLYANFISIKNLDLSNNVNLVKFQAFYSDLEKVDFGINDKLKYVNIRMSNMKELDLSQNPAVDRIFLMNNQLTYLNVANGNNKNFDEFNVSNNPELNCIQVDDSYWSNGVYNWPEGLIIRANWFNNDGPFYKFDFDDNINFSNYCEYLTLEEFNDESFIYPNPTTDKIYFNYSNFNHAIIYNINGRILNKTYSSEFDLSSYKNQLFIIEVYNHKLEKLNTHKVVKSNEL